MASLKYDVIANIVSRSQVAADRMFEIAEERFEAEKQNVIDRFDNDPVTKEIESSRTTPGEDNNISGTLGGYGNLFSFIGFESGDNPIPRLRQAVIDSWTLIKTRKSAIVRGKKIVYNFTSKVDVDAIEEASSTEWEEGVSWARGIRRGISGVGQYFRRKLAGRSGGGFQSEKGRRGGNFQTRDYIFEFINSALRRLKGK